MSNITFETSPSRYARTAGLLYLIMIVLGFVQVMFIRGSIVVSGNAAATASNLTAMELKWRIGIAAEMYLIIITVVLGVITYLLTKPVSRQLALLALIFNMLAVTVEAGYSLKLLEALFPLGNAPYLKAFTPEQLYAMTNLSIKAHSIGFGIALLLFGPFFLVTGYLIFRSGYFPKSIGILYMIPGISYMTSSFAIILAPAFADRFYFIIAGPALIGELSLCLWLLIKGVNIQKWNEKQQQVIAYSKL